MELFGNKGDCVYEGCAYILYLCITLYVHPSCNRKVVETIEHIRDFNMVSSGFAKDCKTCVCVALYHFVLCVWEC
jgi:hypothetical protein